MPRGERSTRARYVIARCVRGERVTDALLNMVKLDIAALESA
jgi:hypothetical protein